MTSLKPISSYNFEVKTFLNRSNTNRYLVIDFGITLEEVLWRMQRIFVEYLRNTKEKRRFTLQYIPRARKYSEIDESGAIRLLNSKRFDSKHNVTEGKYHARFWRVFNAINRQLTKNRINSKCVMLTSRELFYLLKDGNKIFTDQREVDKMVQTLASVLHVPRVLLGIVAASRGAIYGEIGFFESGKKRELLHRAAPNALQINNYLDKSNGEWGLLSSTIKYLIIIEKEACFQQLMSSEFCSRNTILMTGMGYPPMLVRKIAKEISIKLGLHAFCLVDNDPHGFDIFLTYQQGSINSPEAYLYAMTDLEYLGLEWSDVKRYDLPSNLIQPFMQSDEDKMKTLAKYYMGRRGVNRSKMTKRVRYQFKLMQRRRQKIELESLVKMSYACVDGNRVECCKKTFGSMGCYIQEKIRSLMNTDVKYQDQEI